MSLEMPVKNRSIPFEPFTFKPATQRRVLGPELLLVEIAELKRTNLREIMQPVSRRSSNATFSILPTPLERIEARFTARLTVIAYGDHRHVK